MAWSGSTGAWAHGPRICDGEDEADNGPLRLCAVSRAPKPPEELIRFVAGPDGAIVPDLARRLPGRGVWVDATREAVAAAVRQKAFAKSLKRQVSVPADLAGPGREADGAGGWRRRSASPTRRACWWRASPRSRS